MLSELLILAETATSEDAQVDFKSEFSPEKKKRFWVEIVKDIAGFANTLGGVIIFGANDDGSNAPSDCMELTSFDPAKIIDQINLYTGTQFSQFSVTSVVRNGSRVAILAIEPSRVPFVFIKPGTYEVEEGKQKTAFSVGTVYFRHGAKSAPGTQDDLRASFDRELARVRQEWLGNMRLVAETPPGSTVSLVVPERPISDLRLSSDPNAPAVTVRNLSDTHPFRQTEVIRLVRNRVPNQIKFNSHDIQAIKLVEGIDHESRPDLVHKPHADASPQYTAQFIDEICASIEVNPNYLTECRKHHKESRYGPQLP